FCNFHYGNAAGIGRPSAKMLLRLNRKSIRIDKISKPRRDARGNPQRNERTDNEKGTGQQI
ncbi:MAG: hypothetical protein J6I56_00165, partial [Lachnospiraceae bacterium]|nr:hypothetical protein [Lachnospiraceae bacterium]